jgi:DNA (cytosine-5)-methyltransferase 1
MMVDLFAGCGGLSLGLHESGWRSLFAIERDPMAFETYRRNLVDDSAPFSGSVSWPEWLPKEPLDIENVLGDPEIVANVRALRGDVGLLVGGPPCQGFSVGGIRDGRDKRNHLVHRLLDFVELLEPPLVLIENVEGITRAFLSKPNGKRHSVADEVVAALRLLGYDAAYTLVDTSRFGVPQVRRRVLILGVHSSVAQGKAVARYLPDALLGVRRGMLDQLGLPTDRPVTVGEAIGDLDGPDRVRCPDSPKFEAGTYREPTSAFERLMRQGVSEGALPDSHRFSVHGPGIRSLYETAHATQPPGRLAKAFLLAQGTKKDKKVLLDATQSASTITTHPDEFIHYAHPRNITVREMARLQSFPDQFHFFGRYTINGPRRRFDVARCSQVGNAVPPLLARAVGLALPTLLSAAAGDGSDLSTRMRPAMLDDMVDNAGFFPEVA